MIPTFDELYEMWAIDVTQSNMSVYSGFSDLSFVEFVYSLGYTLDECELITHEAMEGHSVINHRRLITSLDNFNKCLQSI